MRHLALGLVALAVVALAAGTVEAGTFSAPAAGHASVTLVAHHGHGGFHGRPGYAYGYPRVSHHYGCDCPHCRARVHPPMIVYPRVQPYRSLYRSPYPYRYCGQRGGIYYRRPGFGIPLGF